MQLSLHRHWDKDRRTYRFIGMHRYLGLKWYHLRFGFHVDYTGRLYIYLGKPIVFQDVIRFGRRRTEFKTSWFGPIEIALG